MNLPKQTPMRRVRIFSIALLSTMVMTVAGSAAPLWHHVTVVSTEGWRYDDVTVMRSETADSLIVTHTDKSTSTVAFAVIESITDALGNDITALVLDREVEKTERIRPGGSVETGNSRPSRGYRFTSAFSFGAGASAVTGFRFEGLRGKVNFETAARVRVLDRAYIGFVWNRQFMDYREAQEESLYDYEIPYQLGDFSQHELYVVIGGNSNPQLMKQPLFLFEIGVGTITYWGAPATDTTLADPPDSERKWDLSIRLAAAVIVPLDRAFGVMLGVNTRFTGDFLKEGGSTGTLIGAHLGLVYMAGA